MFEDPNDESYLKQLPKIIRQPMEYIDIAVYLNPKGCNAKIDIKKTRGR